MELHEGNFVDALRRRQEKGLDYVLAHYAGLYKAIIAKTLRGLPAYREECLSDVLLAIWENIDAIDPGRGSFKNWSAAIARYHAIGYLRRYQEEGREVDLEEALGLPYHEDHVLWQWELEDLLANLSEEDRSLFVDLFLKDMTVDEVAQKREATRGSIYSRVSRARKKLRLFIEKEGI